MRKLRIVASLSAFGEKVKALALSKGGQTRDIVEALAELDYPPAKYEQVLTAYLEVVTAGKHLDKKWAQRVSKIVKEVSAAMQK